MTEDFVIKYLWSACGYGLTSIPILFPSVQDALHSSTHSEDYHQVAMRTEGLPVSPYLVLHADVLQVTCRVGDYYSRSLTRGDV